MRASYHHNRNHYSPISVVVGAAVAGVAADFVAVACVVEPTVGAAVVVAVGVVVSCVNCVCTNSWSLDRQRAVVATDVANVHAAFGPVVDCPSW